jgi:hypothetical protein
MKQQKVVRVQHEAEMHQASLVRVRPTVVCYKASGWEKEPNEYNYPGFKLCSTQNRAPCDAIPVWCTTRKGPGYRSTGYYCDQHLEPDLRPDAQ